jgi:hypothetical protein
LKGFDNVAELLSKKDIPKEIQIPDEWEPMLSAEHFNSLYTRVRENGAEALVNIYIAHELLVADSKKKKNRQWPDWTFERYIDTIEPNRRTVFRWLRKYFGIKEGIVTFDTIPVFDLPPRIYHQNAVSFLQNQEDRSADLLLTDPPYSTDVQDLPRFIRGWLPLALSKVRPTGRAYVCVGAYPYELREYFNCMFHKNHAQEHIYLDQLLVWTYRNTLGPKPKNRYIQTWQAVLYFVGNDAPDLDCPEMVEQFDVQDISAPDGRHGTRLHAWQKPDELGRRLVSHSTEEHDTVIDPFAGTGAFLVAAAALGRQGIGCDTSKEMISIAKERGCV